MEEAMMTCNRAYSLRKQLALLIALKISALTVIWWVCVRDHKVPHDTAHTARHLVDE